MADEDEDFEFQLRQQQLHAETAGQQPEGEQSGSTYTDPNDGTVYEWDAEKRAWFPKVRSRHAFLHSIGIYVLHTSEHP